jgi:hypothetical protein
MELRFNHVCSKCGERLDVIGREMSKYEDELTIMIKPCKNCSIDTKPYAKVSAVNVESALG